MKKITLALLTMLAFAQVNAQEKWTSLFDGKTTNGWHSYGEKTAGVASVSYTHLTLPTIYSV